MSGHKIKTQNLENSLKTHAFDWLVWQWSLVLTKMETGLHSEFNYLGSKAVGVWHSVLIELAHSSFSFVECRHT
jgi:hypothetical protein